MVWLALGSQGSGAARRGHGRLGAERGPARRSRRSRLSRRSRRSRSLAARPLWRWSLRIRSAASVARASGRRISGYQCRRLNGLRPFRCPPPPTWDLGTCAEERARYLLGGPPMEPVNNRWGVLGAARGAGGGRGGRQGSLEAGGGGRRRVTTAPGRGSLGGVGCQDGGRHLVARAGRDGRSGSATRGGWLGAALGTGPRRRGPALLLGWDRLKLATEIALAYPALAREF